MMYSSKRTLNLRSLSSSSIRPRPLRFHARTSATPPAHSSEGPMTPESSDPSSSPSGTHHAAETSSEEPSHDRPAIPPSHRSHYGSLTFMQAFLKEQYSGAPLFILGGSALAAVLLAWARGSALRITDPYAFSVIFNQAPGIEVGTPLRLHGVAIGSVSSVSANLEEARAQVQVFQKSSRIPRGSDMVFNRAGPLSPSPFIDVVLPDRLSLPVDLLVDVDVDGKSETIAATPLSPLILPFEGGRYARVAEAVAGPEQVEACRAEGVLLCALDEVKGKQGGGMDELTALMLRSVKRGADPLVLPPHLRPS